MPCPGLVLFLLTIYFLLVLEYQRIRVICPESLYDPPRPTFFSFGPSCIFGPFCIELQDFQPCALLFVALCSTLVVVSCL
jgi:hypothetical protein